MSNHRPQILAVALVALAVGGLAIAPGSFDPPRRLVRPVVTPTPQLRAELAALEAAGMPAERVVSEPRFSDPMNLRVLMERTRRKTSS